MAVIEAHIIFNLGSWSQAQVLVGPPEMKIPTFGSVFFFERYFK